MPNSSQQNAFNGAQSTGIGVIYDALGNARVIGAQMTAGASSGYVVTSDANGNLTLQSAGAGPGALLAANNLSDLASVTTARANLDLAATVPSLPQTYTGGSSIVDALPGPTIAANTITAAGQIWQFQLWGTVTTTVDTQTVKFQARYGGLAGTILVDTGPVAPSGSTAVTGADIRFTGTVQFLSASAATASAQTDLNFFPSSVNQNAAAVDSTTAKQLVIGLTPSSSAVSVTVNGGFWLRIY